MNGLTPWLMGAFLLGGPCAAWCEDGTHAADPHPPQVEEQKPQVAYLGIDVVELPLPEDQVNGLPLKTVLAYGTAWSLGLRVGDHLRVFNGQRLHVKSDLLQALAKVHDGDIIHMEYSRKGDGSDITNTVSGKTFPMIIIDKTAGHVREERHLIYCSDKLFLHDQFAYIKIYVSWSSSWPGNNDQLAVIVSEEGKELARQNIGGEPICISCRAVPYFYRALVYVKCNNRRMEEQSEYIYEVGEDYKFTPSNIYISPEDAEHPHQDESLNIKDLEHIAGCF